MWDRRKSETAPPVAAPATAPVIPPVPQQPNFAAPPSAPQAKGPGTQIGKSITIIGEIYSEEDLFIDGEVEGEVEAHEAKLTVGPNGKAKSHLKAQEVIILGQVQGDIDASQKITIRREGSLVGNIRTTGIVIDDDAYFKGSIDIVRKPAEADRQR